jgi:transcriptional regulator with XRE-family HTH domain
VIVSRAQLGAEVAKRRRAAGLSQAQLAALAGLDEATIVAIERAERKLEPFELGRLAEALGVDELDLLRRPPPGYLIIPGAHE